MLCANSPAQSGAMLLRGAEPANLVPALTSALPAGNAQSSSVFEYVFSFRHDDIVTCADFSKDGRRLATGSELGTVLITDIESRKETTVSNPDSRGNGVQALRFSQDGRFLVVGGEGNKNGGGQIRFLRTTDYTTAMAFDVPGDKAISYVDLSPDSKWLVASDLSGVWVWNLESKRIAWQRSFDHSALQYDGSQAVLFISQSPTPPSSSGQIAFLNIADGKVIRTLKTEIKEPVRRLVMVQSKSELFALTDGAIVYRVNTSTGATLQRISISDLGLEARPKDFSVWYHTDFEVLDSYPIFVFSDRRHTVLMNYVSRQVVTINHGSQVGIKFNPQGRGFALLGGVKDGSLSGIPPQHYWTVSVFSFKPF
jgi:WD40 repeat protein